MPLAVGRPFWSDVAAIMHRYEREREGLGDEFLDAVDAALGAQRAAPSRRERVVLR